LQQLQLALALSIGNALLEVASVSRSREGFEVSQRREMPMRFLRMAPRASGHYGLSTKKTVDSVSSLLLLLLKAKLTDLMEISSRHRRPLPMARLDHCIPLLGIMVAGRRRYTGWYGDVQKYFEVRLHNLGLWFGYAQNCAMAWHCIYE